MEEEIRARKREIDAAQEEFKEFRSSLQNYKKAARGNVAEHRAISALLARYNSAWDRENSAVILSCRKQWPRCPEG